MSAAHQIVIACVYGCIVGMCGQQIGKAQEPGTPQQETPQQDNAATVFSGPQVGESLVPFSVIIAEGDQKGQTVQLASPAAQGPLFIVFVHERTRPSLGLTNAVTRFALTRRSQGMEAAIVFLTSDPTEVENWLKRVPDFLPKAVTIGISPDGSEGPGAYGLNRNVALTALVGNKGIVTANFALVQPDLETDGTRMMKAMADVTGGGSVASISEFIGRQRMNAGRMSGRQPGNPNAPQTESQDPMLRPLLAPLINKQATEAQVDDAASAIIRYANANPAARRQIADIANRIIQADNLTKYGTPPAQAYLKTWAVEFMQPVDKQQ